MNEKKIANLIYERTGKLKANQQDIFDKVEMYHQMYRASLNYDETYPWDYDLTDPVVFQLMRSILSRLNPDGYKVQLEARKSSAQSVRDLNQDVINWELSELKKTLVLYRILFRGMLAGRGYIETGWKFEKAVQIQYGNKNDNTFKTLRDVINRADAKNVRFQDMFIPNHNIPELDEQPYLIQRVSKRFGDMLDDNELQDKEVWDTKYLEKIQKSRKFSDKLSYGVDLPSDDSYTKDESFARSQYINLLKMQTLDGEVFYTMDDEDSGWILNKDTENPFWHGHYPYLSWTPFPEDDDFFSLGIVQPVSDLAVALTSTLNQFLTNSRKSANPMWIVGKDGAQTPDWMFVNRPDGVIRTAGDVGQIQQAKSTDTGQTMIRARQELMTSFERGTGMSSMYTSGVSGGSSPQLNRTATGAKIIDSNIDVNLQMLVSLFGAQILGNLGDHFLELNTQFMDEEQEIKISDEGEARFVKVDPAEMTANFDVISNPDTVLKVNPIVKQAQLLNFKQVVDQEEDLQMNKKPLWNAIVRAFPEMDNIDSIVIDPEEVAREAISAMMSGIEPEVKPDMDHKMIIKIIQKEMIDSQGSMPDETLKLFADYIDEHKKFIEAENPNLFTPPLNPNPMPTNEQDLMQSLLGGEAQNPTMGLPSPTPLDDMGGAPM